MNTPRCQREECPDRSKPMIVHEYDYAWQFVCPVCYSMQVIAKQKIGGTLGAGLKSNGCREVIGRGA